MTVGFRVPAGVLGEFLDAMQAVVAEAKCTFDSDDGLRARAVDPANVAMADVEVPADAFERVSGDGTTLGVNLESLADVVGMAPDGESAIVGDLDADSRKLALSIPEIGLDYTLALIDPDTIRQEPDLPELELPATYVADVAALDRGITAADLCSDHLTLRAVDGDTFEICADGDTDDVEVTLGGEELLDGRHDGDAPAASFFSLDYLLDLRGPLPSDATVSVRVGDEMPTKLRYTTASGVEVENMLAPRISSEG